MGPGGNCGLVSAGWWEVRVCVRQTIRASFQHVADFSNICVWHLLWIFADLRCTVLLTTYRRTKVELTHLDICSWSFLVICWIDREQNHGIFLLIILRCLGRSAAGGSHAIRTRLCGRNALSDFLVVSEHSSWKFDLPAPLRLPMSLKKSLPEKTVEKSARHCENGHVQSLRKPPSRAHFSDKRQFGYEFRKMLL